MRTPNHAATLDARSLAVLVPALCCALTVANVEARSPIFHPASSAQVATAWAAPLAWTEQKVTASNGLPHDAFGQSIAIRGTTALIGAVDVNNWEGAIYVFTQTGGVWTEGQEFMADDGAPGDQATFGTAIMIDGDTAVIGALGATVNGHANQGAAYVFKETGGVWSQVAKLVAEDGEANNYFGQAAAIAGDNIVVGAYGASVNGNALQGAAYVYSNVGGTWTFVKKLVADDAVGGEFFGRSVAMSGTRALVGAPYASVDGTRGARRGLRVRRLDERLDANGKGRRRQRAIPAMHSRFRSRRRRRTWSSARTAATAGRARRSCSPTTAAAWTQQARLVADDGAAGDDIGYAVAILDTTLIVGADRAAINEQHAARRCIRVRRKRATRGRRRRSSSQAMVQTDEFYGAFVALVGSVGAGRRAVCDRRRQRGAGRGIFLRARRCRHRSDFRGRVRPGALIWRRRCLGSARNGWTQRRLMRRRSLRFSVRG